LLPTGGFGLIVSWRAVRPRAVNLLRFTSSWTKRSFTLIFVKR